MGTPEFAVPSLQVLLEHDYNMVAVVTAPDKPAGRGMQLQQSAIKKFAIENGLKVLQPVKLKDPSFLNNLKELKPDLQIVVAFRMLPELVWQLPAIGTFNLHGSLLPQYRGAAPINWAIINGETETGVTTFFLQHEIDTGKILFQEKIAIGENETAGMLHDRMKLVGAALVLKTVQAIETESYPQIAQQENSDLRKAPKLFNANCSIDWQQPVSVIFNQIRGLSPSPAAYTLLNGKVLKILSAKKIRAQHALSPGAIATDGKTFLHFAAADGFIAVETLKMEGKKQMEVKEFLRGFRIDNG
ncbi:MAG: methionyl-tRNA formyltransferase [Chitinophagaceae bacterium]|nr:methionyl-tRNA formyltransferase [Chitinophagaceae bacterium]